MGAGLRDIAPKEVYSAKVAEAAGTGDFEVVAAVSGKKIVVIVFNLTDYSVYQFIYLHHSPPLSDVIISSYLEQHNCANRPVACAIDTLYIVWIWIALPSC